MNNIVDRLTFWFERKTWFLGRRFGFVSNLYGWKKGPWIVSRQGFATFNEGGHWFTAYVGWGRGVRGFRVWCCPPGLAGRLGPWMSIGWIEHSRRV